MNSALLNSKVVAPGWLALVGLVVILALQRGPVFDSSILSLLPQSEQDAATKRASEHMGREFSGRLLLILSGADDASLREAVAAMANALAGLSEVSRIDWRADDAEVASLRNELLDYRFVLLDEELRERLRQRDFESLRQQALARLFGPLAGDDSLIEDPFGLYFEYWLKRRPPLNLDVSDSMLKLTGTRQPGFLLVVTLDADPFAQSVQSRVLETIEQQRRQLSPAIAEITMSGMLMHAAAGARQAKGEISTIGLGSFIGIVIVMLLVFRQARPLLLLLFPVVIGCVFAAAASLLIFERVHLVTFAFGAGLVGVSIDYALHYLCERRVSKASAVLPRILPGLLLGLFSSIAAYAAQAMAPFPGLRQMAVFSVLGLAGAWLTVVLWFPRLSGTAPLSPLPLADRLIRLRRGFPRLDESRGLAGILTLLLVSASILIWRGEPLDDIRLLRTSPPTLLEQERALHRALGSSGSSRYILVAADTLEACLQIEEQLYPRLSKMRQDGTIADFQMLSSGLPSLKRQAENFDLVEALYRRELEALISAIGLSPEHATTARNALHETAATRLTRSSWNNLAVSGAQSSLLLVDEPGLAISVIRFAGELSDDALRELGQIAAGMPEASMIDQVKTVSDLLGKYRVQMSRWLVVAYLLVFAVLSLRYRLELWRIVLPPLAASILTLAILVELVHGINLFHVMALILVLGIGIDMGIFLSETREAAHTWLAVSLSAFTSLLAFGLLAGSTTPVLHHFGLTVAIGLSLVWLMSPLVRRS